MRVFVLGLLALLTSPALAAPPGEIEIQADVIEAQGLDEAGEAKTVVGEGNVHVRSGPLVLRAPRLEVQRDQKRAFLEGGVVGGSGLLVVSADKLSFDLDTKTLQLNNGQLVVKSGVSAQEVTKLVEGDTPIAARTAGKNALTLRADRLSELPGGLIQAKDVWFTTCECRDGSTPFLSISASEVTMERGESASLWWPTFRVFDVPVLPLPYASVPLSQRRSGVLFPLVNFSGPTGISAQLPFFLTLGESADLTLTLGAFNGGNTSFKLPDDTFRQGVRGFGDEAELRWRTAVDAAGSLRFQHFYDFNPDPNTTTGRGNRGAVFLRHEGNHFGGHAGLDLQALSDTALLLDTQARIEQANLPYLRSRAAYALSRGSIAFGLDSTAIQSLMLGGVRVDAGLTQGVIAPLGRMGLQDSRAVGRLVLDQGTSILFERALPGLDPTPSRTQRALANVTLGQTLPLYAGPYGNVALEAGERADGILTAGGDEPSGRIGGFVGAVGRTRLSRSFSSGWLHEIVPSLQVRALGGLGSADFSNGLFELGTPLPQDEFDAALPASARVQTVSRLSTSVTKQGRTPLALALEHHMELNPVEKGHLIGTLALAPFQRPIVTSLASAWNLERGLMTLLAGRVTSPVGRGQLSVGAQYLNAATNDLITRGLDLLFTPHDVLNRATANGVLPTVQADGAFDVPVGESFRLHLGALFASPYDQSQGDPFVRITQQYNAAASYDAGGCARLGVRLLWTPGSAPQAFVTFELGDVGAAAQAASASFSSAR